MTNDSLSRLECALAPPIVATRLFAVHTLSCDLLRAEKDRANVLPLLPLYRCCDLLLSRVYARVWESDSPWILGDVLTAGWRAIVPSLCLPVARFTAFFFLSPSFLFFIVLTRTDPSPFHATFQVAPINEHTFFLAPDGLLGPGIWIANDCLRRGRGMLFPAPTLERDPEIQLFVDYRLFARITLPTPYILWCISSIPTTHSNKKRCIEEGLEAT